MWPLKPRDGRVQARLSLRRFELRGRPMSSRLPLASLTLLAAFIQISSQRSVAQTLSQLCRPSLTAPIVVASPAQRLAAGARAEPPLTDTFDWPDTPLGVIKTASGYEFFGSDGGAHHRQRWQGHW